MKLINQERIEEFLLIANDNLSTFNKKWWYVLLGVILVSVPIYFIFRTVFFQAFYGDYEGPVVVAHTPEVEPLQITDSAVFKLGENSYSGFAKIRNINLDWGVKEQPYEAVFKTVGGTVVTRVAGKTFVLPASEKILVFSRFTADNNPQVLELSLGEANFTLKSNQPAANLELSRIQMQPQQNEFIVSALVKNVTAFTISQIQLPVVLYNRDGKIIGVNFTSINDVKSSESRSFQVIWPIRIEGAVRAEVLPEVNTFDNKIYRTEQGRSPFDNFLQNEFNQ